MDPSINAVSSLQTSPLAPPASNPQPSDSSPKTAKRGRQKRSSVWQHFEEVETDRNTAICNHCSHPINRGRNARNTTNLHQHLRIRHPELNLTPIASFPRRRKSVPAGEGAGYGASGTAYGGTGRNQTGIASSAVIPLARFIAATGLPLNAVAEPALRQLANAWGVHGALPNVNSMRASGLPRAVVATQTALRSAISSSAVSIVVGDVVDGVRVVWCNALSSRFERSTYALAVYQEGERDGGLLLPRERVASNFGPVPWNVDRLSPMLKGRISTLIARYGILEKLQAVVIAEHSGQFEVFNFSAPREEQQQQQQQQQIVQQQERDNVFNRHPVQEFLDEGARGPHDHNGGTHDSIANEGVNPLTGSRTIPVVPCLSSFMENIVEVEVLGNPWIENSILMPVRFALRPNSPRRNVKKEKKVKRTFDDMGSTASQSFDNDGNGKDDDEDDDSRSKLSKTYELLQNFQKRFGNLTPSRPVDNIDMNSVTELHETLTVFKEAVALLTVEPNPQDDTPPDANAISTVSVAIPVMRSVCRALESNLKKPNGEFSEITKRLLATLSRTQRDLESQEMYAVSTLLDPRFKTRCFSSEEAVRFAESIVLNACRHLERTRENDPESSEAAFVSSSAAKRSGGSMLGQFMDEVVHDRLDSTASVAVYTAEPAFSFSENVAKYWQRNATRWPDLTAVAAKYLCVPACATGGSARQNLLGNVQFESQDLGNMLFLRLNSSLDM